MDNLDDSENNAKISDSAYSNSCSNSQSRRSHSSKFTHSGSHSSGSSGYGGKPSTSGSSNNNDQTSKKDKESKKKKQSQTQCEVKPLEKPVVEQCRPPDPVPHLDVLQEKANDVPETLIPLRALPEEAVEKMDLSALGLVPSPDEIPITSMHACSGVPINVSYQAANVDSGGFSCAISMHDGVVMYTTHKMTAKLGFPKEMWIGRSFIDFVHPKDRNTFASQITKGLAVPKIVKGTQDKGNATPGVMECSMVCRIRLYRTLGLNFGIKDRGVAYMPFLLRFSFKDVKDDGKNVVYLIIQAIPYYSAFKTPCECMKDAIPFITRHSADGILEYIDIESVPYLGYLPQDIHSMDILLMYHPEDLPYLKVMYESIVKDGRVSRSLPLRMLAQNGDYVKLETEWSSFVNPWSMKLEFVIGKHYVVQGPKTPDVFLPPPPPSKAKTTEDKQKSEMVDMYRKDILNILKRVLTKPAEKAKQQMSKRCQDLAAIMENLLEDQPKHEMGNKDDPQENCFERDSVMLGGISPHHEYSDSKTESTETQVSYNQLNFNENLQRYFDSHQNTSIEGINDIAPTSKTSVASHEIGELTSNCLSPFESQSGESSHESGSAMSNIFSPPAPSEDSKQPRLTESRLTKHNTAMEKELAKLHRESKSSSKGERDQENIESRLKKKEHLARCNATYHPTMAGAPTDYLQPHGLKRASKLMESEIAHKQHCSNNRQSRCRQDTSQTNQFTVPTTGVRYPSPPPSTGHMASCPNASCQQAPDSATTQPNQRGYSNGLMPWAYPQAMYGSPNMYPPMPYHMQQYHQHNNHHIKPLELANNNYVQACKARPLKIPRAGQRSWRDRRRAEYLASSNKMQIDQSSGDSSSIPFNQSTETSSDMSMPEKSGYSKSGPDSSQPVPSSDEPVERTDGESSYSSFYSSFFKTESGSADDSSDPKKPRLNNMNIDDGQGGSLEPQIAEKVAQKRLGPPWLEQVSMTPELIFKYQIPKKSNEEILKADKERIKNLKQPTMVNEQLGQLYLDLQLEGVAARLTLEDGISSSGSSCEEPSPTDSKLKSARRKRMYSKMTIIHEENAPLPPPSDSEDCSLEEPPSCEDSKYNDGFPLIQDPTPILEQPPHAMEQVPFAYEQMPCTETQTTP